MRHRVLRFAPLALLLTVGGSDRAPLLDPVVARNVSISAKSVGNPLLQLSARLRFVAGWELESEDAEFGGISALSIGPEEMVMLTDKGATFQLPPAFDRPVLRAKLRPLPAGCANDRLKLDRDSESIARDPAGGNLWIGFEWRNAICRADAGLARALRVTRPIQMQDWPRTGGPEAMTRLADGRFVAIAERGGSGARDSAMLVFDGDPTRPGAMAVERRYRPPRGYRPVDVAELADGSLLILHRRFRMPLDFSSILSLVPRTALDSDAPISGRPLAVLNGPELTDNYEGLAVRQEGQRTFIWLVSDDNFVLTQKTYLLKFELLGGSGVR